MNQRNERKVVFVGSVYVAPQQLQSLPNAMQSSSRFSFVYGNSISPRASQGAMCGPAPDTDSQGVLLSRFQRAWAQTDSPGFLWFFVFLP